MLRDCQIVLPSVAPSHAQLNIVAPTDVTIVLGVVLSLAAFEKVKRYNLGTLSR